jgi:hypothetical protein
MTIWQACTGTDSSKPEVVERLFPPNLPNCLRLLRREEQPHIDALSGYEKYCNCGNGHMDALAALGTWAHKILVYKNPDTSIAGSWFSGDLLFPGGKNPISCQVDDRCRQERLASEYMSSAFLRTARLVPFRPLNRDRKPTALARFIWWQVDSRILPGRLRKFRDR